MSRAGICRGGDSGLSAGPYAGEAVPRLARRWQSLAAPGLHVCTHNPKIARAPLVLVLADATPAVRAPLPPEPGAQ